MVEALSSNYWISASALHISLNAMGSPEYIQASVASGSYILCYMKTEDTQMRDTLGFDNGHNYRRWQLVASPTFFVSTSRKYVYVAIPRVKYTSGGAVIPNDNPVAQIVYPSERIDIYGCNENGAQIGSVNYYYIYLQGIISASVDDLGATVDRVWEAAINTGTLASDEALAAGAEESIWFKYDPVTDTVRFLKRITNAIFTALEAGTATITNLVLGGQSFVGAADPENEADDDASNKIVTPNYGRTMYLSRKYDDTAAGHLTFNLGFHSKNDGVVDTNLTAGGFTGSKSFATGLLGNGWRVNAAGHGEMDSLSLRKFLEVPELRFNRITVRTGVQWQTHGAGLIEEVTQLTSTTGIIKLKLEEGEYGAVAVDDLCMGIYHNETNLASNASQNVDSHNGNF